MLNLLLVASSAGDTFIYNYAKWLKASMDIHIDVFEFFPADKQEYDRAYYDSVARAGACPVPKVRALVDPLVKGRALRRYLKGKHYDIIHCQWVTAPMVLQKDIKRHCRKLVLSFWGGEFKKQRVLGSNRLYLRALDRLTRQADGIINGVVGKDKLLAKIPGFKGRYYRGYLGSAPLEALFDLMKVESREASKQKLGIPAGKTTVLIGYSGKSIHQHIPIIRALKAQGQLQARIHLIAPMTRGGVGEYVRQVEEELKASGFSYSFFSGRFLSDEEIGRIRNATDIALQLSTFDGFSRSILECLCAKSVLVYGDWLPYVTIMKAYGFEGGIAVSGIEDCAARLGGIAAKLDDFKEIAERDSENGRHQAIWSECIRDWVAAYNDLLA